MKSTSFKRLAILAMSIQIGGCSVVKTNRRQARLPQVSTKAHQVASPAGNGGKRSIQEKTGGLEASQSRISNGKLPSTRVPVQPIGPRVTTTDVTLGDSDGYRSRAQALLDQADANLAQIDRSKLTGDTSTQFEQASGLADAAHKAMEQGDYLAASGLARKASTLAKDMNVSH
jgi:hypothetical protein